MLRHYRDVGLLVNEISTMGLEDPVPEVVRPAVEHKPGFVHRVVRGADVRSSQQAR